MLLALLGLQAPAPMVLEAPDPASSLVVVQATASAPYEFGPTDQGLWNVLCDLAVVRTRNLSASEVRRFGGQAGYAPRASCTADLIRIDVAMPSGGLDIAALLIEEFLAHPFFDPLEVDASVADLSERRFDAWTAALYGVEADYGRVNQERLTAVHEMTFRRDRVTIVVAGDVEPGEGMAIFEGRLPDPGPPPRRSRIQPEPEPIVSNDDRARSYAWSLPPILPASPGASAQMLAAVALGIGKESAAHRALRETHGWTYRQEAMLFPTKDGWTPRLIALRAGEPIEDEVSRFEQALIAEIDTWDETDRLRALAVAESGLSLGMGYNPFWNDLGGSMGDDIFGRTAWIGYVAHIGAAGLSPDTMFSAMENVDLETLRTTAKRWVEEGSLHVVEAGRR